jgi:hypothetical protein
MPQATSTFVHDTRNIACHCCRLPFPLSRFRGWIGWPSFRQMVNSNLSQINIFSGETMINLETMMLMSQLCLYYCPNIGDPKLGQREKRFDKFDEPTTILAILIDMITYKNLLGCNPLIDKIRYCVEWAKIGLPSYWQCTVSRFGYSEHQMGIHKIRSTHISHPCSSP